MWCCVGWCVICDCLECLALKMLTLRSFKIVWDSSVGIATCYGLDVPGIDPRWEGARFSAPVNTDPGAHPASCTMGTGSFPGVKLPWRGGDHPSRSGAEVKRRVELYHYSPSGPSWPVIGWTLLLRLLLRSFETSGVTDRQTDAHTHIYAQNNNNNDTTTQRDISEDLILFQHQSHDPKTPVVLLN
jgi:hypothetical protein